MPVVINGSNTPTAGGVAIGNGSELQFTPAGTSGQVLVSNGAGAPTWQTGGGTLPSQTGQAGNFLTTDGSTASWAPVGGGGGGSSFTATASGSLTAGYPVVVNLDGTVSSVSSPTYFNNFTSATSVPGTQYMTNAAPIYDPVNNQFFGFYVDFTGNLTYVQATMSAGVVTAAAPAVLTAISGGGSMPSFANSSLYRNGKIYTLAYAYSGAMYIIVSTISGSSLVFENATPILTSYSGSMVFGQIVYDSFNNQAAVIVNSPYSGIPFTTISTYTLSGNTVTQTGVKDITTALGGTISIRGCNLLVNPVTGRFAVLGIGDNGGTSEIFGLTGNLAGLGSGTSVTVNIPSPPTPAPTSSFVSSAYLVSYGTGSTPAEIIFCYQSNIGTSSTGPRFLRATIFNWTNPSPFIFFRSNATSQMTDSNVGVRSIVAVGPANNPRLIAVANSDSGLNTILATLEINDASVPAQLDMSTTTLTNTVALQSTFVTYGSVSSNNAFIWGVDANGSSPTSYFIMQAGMQPQVNSNQTAYNLVGLSDANYSNGATATIKTLGAVDTNQNGLTPGNRYFSTPGYFVPGIAPTGSVVVGRAISATDILITL